MIPFIFKSVKSRFTYYLPTKIRYGILLMDPDDNPDNNPLLVVINYMPLSDGEECNLSSDKETAIKRLEEMREAYPQCTYKLIKYTLLSN